MPTCKKCGIYFPNWVMIDGNERDIHTRKRCLNCYPYTANKISGIKSDRYCIVCGEQLSGKQRKYCSRKCKIKTFSSYPKQKERGIVRKLRLIEMAGGKCAKCGYKENIAVLSFHHLDGDKKDFKLDARHLSNRVWGKIMEEFDKCILLCANCHMEEHHPNMRLDALREKYGAKIEELK